MSTQRSGCSGLPVKQASKAGKNMATNVWKRIFCMATPQALAKDVNRHVVVLRDFISLAMQRKTTQMSLGNSGTSATNGFPQLALIHYFATKNNTNEPREFRHKCNCWVPAACVDTLPCVDADATRMCFPTSLVRNGAASLHRQALMGNSSFGKTNVALQRSPQPGTLSLSRKDQE